jgi:predicted acylesterase/phospholipase RssA
MTDPRAGKQAAVLSGGAAYAAYEVGVLKALARGECAVTGFAPLDFDVVTGTSAGSFNAAVMASRPGESSAATAAYLQDVWLDGLADRPGRCGNGAVRYRGNLFRLLNPDCFWPDPAGPLAALAGDTADLAREFFERALNFTFSRQALARRFLELIDPSTFISTDPFRALLRQAVDLGRVRASHKVLRVAATNWRTGEVKIFANADMTDTTGHDIILASSAFPGLPPVSVAGEPYADGGMTLDTPLKPAVYAGADTLHVVYMDPDVRNIPLRRLQNVLDTLDRTYTVFKAAIFNRDIECAEDIDRGLTILERPEAGDRLSWDLKKSLARFVGQFQEHADDPTPLRKVTVHRYHPRDDLGGVLGLLNFDQDQLAGLIERGFTDAAEHDCVASQCILPEHMG